ncbi:unnamed protein product, partial [Prorocentrum cordatum]
ALQGLQYADDHPLIVAAKAELADLEIAERQAQPPDVVLRELQAKLTDARERRAKSGTHLIEAEERVATLHKLQTTIDGEIEVLEQEAAQATRAVAAVAAGPSGVDLQGLATTLCGLQTLLSVAPTQVQNGQGIALLESINAQVQAMGMAFPAAQALQAAATGVAPDAAGQHAEATSATSAAPAAAAPAQERQLQLGRTQARCEQRGRRRAARKNVVLVTYNRGLVLVAAYFEVGKWAAGVNAARLFDIATALRWWNRPVPGWPAAPHYPMQVSLDARAMAVKFPALSGPKAFPKAAPDEDGIPVAAVDHQGTIEADAARGGEATAVQAQVRLDSLYATFMDAAEDELLARYCIDTD